MNDLPSLLIESLWRHLPADYSWLPTAGLALLAVAGLVFALRGARLAPALAGLVFAALGVAAGHAAAPWIAAPLWIVAAVGGGLGALLGVLLFRLWLGALVAATLCIAGLIVYAGNALQAPLTRYSSSGFDAESQMVSLPVAVDTGRRSEAGAEAARLWNYLSEQVPTFESSFWAIVGSTCVAGLLLGLLLPRVSRALWAATMGTVLLGVATVGSLRAWYPPGLDWLLSLGAWSWLPVGLVWLMSLAANYRDLTGRRAVKVVHAAPAGQPVAA